MPLFRKKPIVVTAERLTQSMVVKTLEGDMKANPGDWLIKGVHGEFYPCKDDIFRKTYEPVDNAGVHALTACGPSPCEFPETIPFPGLATVETT